VTGSAEIDLTEGLRELALERSEVDLVMWPRWNGSRGPGARPPRPPAATPVVVLRSDTDAVIEVAGALWIPARPRPIRGTATLPRTGIVVCGEP
jgi:hypothetical protein